MRAHFFLTIAINLLLAACATSQKAELASSAPPTQTESKNLPGGTQNNGEIKPPKSQPNNGAVSLVRYIGWDSTHWPTTNSGNNIAQYYTQLEIYSDAETGGPGTKGNPNLRAYDKEKRSWFQRLMESETDTVTTLANVTVIRSQDRLNFSVPLFSVSHASGRDLGNNWVTNFTQSSVDTPLFLVGAGAKLKVEMKVEASHDLKSQAAAQTIGAVTKAVQIAAPSASLVTALTSSQVNSTADAIDTTLSKLFSSDTTEIVDIGRFADSWRPENKLIVHGCAPFVQFDSSPTGDGACATAATAPDAKVGQWTLQLRCPKISVFDGALICKPDNTVLSETDISAAKQEIARRVTNGTILRFGLSKDVTISDWVLKQSWYTGFITLKTYNAEVYENFCAAALSGEHSIASSGLSDFDAALVLRAVIHGMAGVASHAEAFQSNGACMTILGAQASAVPL